MEVDTIPTRARTIVYRVADNYAVCIVGAIGAYIVLGIVIALLGALHQSIILVIVVAQVCMIAMRLGDPEFTARVNRSFERFLSALTVTITTFMNSMDHNTTGQQQQRSPV